MSLPPAAPRGRSPWLYVLGGFCLFPFSCAIVSVCLALASLTSLLVTPARAAASARPAAATAVPVDLAAAVAALPAGSAEAGEALFSGTAGCQGCHALAEGQTRVGPTLAGLAGRAADRRADYTAEMYLYEAITAPEAYVVAGYPASVMPGNFQQRLSAQQLADLIAFLLTR